MSVIQAKSLHEAEDLLNSGMVKKSSWLLILTVMSFSNLRWNVVTVVRKLPRVKISLSSHLKNGSFRRMTRLQQKATF